MALARGVKDNLHPDHLEIDDAMRSWQSPARPHPGTAADQRIGRDSVAVPGRCGACRGNRL